MKGKAMTKSQYAKLLKEIRAILEEGKERIRRTTQGELARVYWEIGRKITQAGLTERSHYGEAVLNDISEELDIHITTLRNAILFFKQEKRDSRVVNLPWTHRRHLLPIRDPEERLWYENLAINEALPSRALKKAIEDDAYAESSGPPTGAGPRIKRPTDPTFIYKAKVLRVIDGDTLLLSIDLGFGVWKEERVRLAQIDAPPLDTKEGKEADRFVRKAVDAARTIMIKTSRKDLHGRYVADVFYASRQMSKAKIFQQGNYLNAEILSKGLAKKY